MGNDGAYVTLGLKVWKAQIERADILFGSLSSEAILLSRTNHLSYHLGQAVLGLT